MIFLFLMYSSEVSASTNFALISGQSFKPPQKSFGCFPWMRVLFLQGQMLWNIMGSAKPRSALLAFCFAKKWANAHTQHCALLTVEFGEESKTLGVPMLHSLIKDDAIREIRGVRAQWLMPKLGKLCHQCLLEFSLSQYMKRFSLMQLPVYPYLFSKDWNKVLWKWTQATMHQELFYLTFEFLFLFCKEEEISLDPVSLSSSPQICPLLIVNQIVELYSYCNLL